MNQRKLKTKYIVKNKLQKIYKKLNNAFDIKCHLKMNKNNKTMILQTKKETNK